MATRHIQLRQNESQRRTNQEVELDGVRVVIRAWYIPATDRWYFSMFDLSEVPILAGIACVPGVDLLRQYRHLPIPQGELFCSSADRSPPTFKTLDVNNRVLYREVGE